MYRASKYLMAHGGLILQLLTFPTCIKSIKQPLSGLLSYLKISEFLVQLGYSCLIPRLHRFAALLGCPIYLLLSAAHLIHQLTGLLGHIPGIQETLQIPTSRHCIIYPFTSAFYFISDS